MGLLASKKVVGELVLKGAEARIDGQMYIVGSDIQPANARPVTIKYAGNDSLKDDSGRPCPGKITDLNVYEGVFTGASRGEVSFANFKIKGREAQFYIPHYLFYFFDTDNSNSGKKIKFTTQSRQGLEFDGESTTCEIYEFIVDILAPGK